MAKRYLFDIVLVTTYGTDGKDIKTYTEDFFDFNGYGYGENYDGLIFAIDMQAREFWSAGTGIGVDVFNNSVIDDLTDIVTPYLSDGEYYEAMDAYLDEAAFYLEMDLGAQGDYKGSEDYDYSLSFGDYFARSAKNLWLVWIICIVVGIIVANVMRVSLKTVKRQPEASQYLKEGSFDVTNSEDMFITSTISRVKIESNKGGGGGGGSSSGRSHSGGGGGF
ncbi:MAG: TPM domain-containing protein [Firmicutes bacterium]|nr:TPM domain-containing protein [Bacillota bacterium]